MRIILARPLVFATVVWLLAGCGGSGGGDSCSRHENCDYASYEPEYVEVDTADVDAQEVEVPTFDNCTDDCSGHDAGFIWAQDNDVTDSSECGGDSQSFIEGCEAFAQQRQELAEEQAQENYEEESYDESDEDYGR